MILKTTFEDAFHYRLFFWNKIGEHVSNVLRLNVTGSPPNVLTSHKIYIKNYSVKLVGTVFVNDQFPKIHTVFLAKNGEKIATSEGGGRYSEVSVDHPSLTIINVNFHDIGSYQLTAINAVGSTVSDTIVLDVPCISLVKSEYLDGSQCFKALINSVPAAFHAEWKVKRKNDKAFTPVDVNDKDYKGTANSLPCPVLVVKQKNLLESQDFIIEVHNFVGSTTKDI